VARGGIDEGFRAVVWVRGGCDRKSSQLNRGKFGCSRRAPVKRAGLAALRRGAAESQACGDAAVRFLPAVVAANDDALWQMVARVLRQDV